MSLFDKMKQAKEVLGNAKKAQEEIEKIMVQGESGAGAVKVTMKGNHKITNIEIDPSALNNDKKMLEDLIMAACNDAINKVEKEIKNKMGDLMNLPSGLKLPF
ncbi:MAG: YbaB/EbfC family nucleoid-associated protein [Pseudomonadota bacterium]|nr:YbaB/EbfC family nucleoid-associated protein [Pseudomonadota bacterium]